MSQHPSLDSLILKEAVDQEYTWLSTTVPLNHCWASYWADKKLYKKRKKDFAALLPLLRDKVHTLSMQFHCMENSTKTIREVNPNQTPVDICDQPVFALTKRLMWKHDRFKKYFCLFGGLHVEKSLLVMHGEFVTGSGLLKLLGISNLSVCSLQTVASTASDIKGARYALQVSACVIYKKLVDAHANSDSSLPILDWLDVISARSTMALYWKHIMELEVHILIYIRSIREGNFQLHIEALRALMKWYFALDHIHYSRWLTVHLFDLVNLVWQHPDVYENFCKGYFAFNKSCSEFSSMALD